MADDTVIIEGAVKFRDGNKWKPRWCVVRKLSPVADCVQLEVRREARGAVKAALSLARLAGCEAGFVLDKHSHTLALLAAELVVVVAFESRERLLHWQSRLRAHVPAGAARLVQVAAGGRLPVGPARLHAAPQRLALATGTPPKLLAVWELPDLRRYGLLQGKLCLEGGSRCGSGAGLTVLRAENEQDLRAALLEAATPVSTPARRTLPRCRSCMSKLGAAAATPVTPVTPTTPRFTPSWTMDALAAECRCGPEEIRTSTPYDNYDVPRLPSVETNDEYYDTPKRVKEWLVEEEVSGMEEPRGACRRVTDWIRLPYCRREQGKENRRPDDLYATVDYSRKTRRRVFPPFPAVHDYENMQFALSLEHYENARDVVRRAAAIPESPAAGDRSALRLSAARLCGRCGQSRTSRDDYLTMAPRTATLPLTASGYAPMSPLGAIVRGPRRSPARQTHDEKSASNPSLEVAGASPPHPTRACSADSARFLCAASASSSLETLRGCAGGPEGAARAVRRSASEPARARDCSSSADSGVSVRSGRRARSSERPVGAGSSSGTSDMSDYIESLSLCSSQSSGEARPTTASLRPRSGAEYRRRPHLAR